MNSITFPKQTVSAPAAADVFQDDMALAEAVVDRIAKLVVMKVPYRQIAMAVGINPNKIEAVCKLPKVQAQVQILTVAELEENSLVNEGWDAVEQEAIGTVLQQLKVSPDADFALRAAATANKAQRRGGNSRETMQAKSTTTAVIELSAVFIEKLQTMQIGMEAINVNAKRIDTLNVQDTQHLFRDTGKVSIDDLFGAGNVTVDGEVIDE